MATWTTRPVGSYGTDRPSTRAIQRLRRTLRRPQRAAASSLPAHAIVRRGLAAETVPPGDLLVRSNIAVEKNPAYVPGELLYTYNSTYFSTAKNPPQIQVDERLFYQPCAICKRAIDDPLCKCGSN